MKTFGTVSRGHFLAPLTPACIVQPKLLRMKASSGYELGTFQAGLASLTSQIEQFGPLLLRVDLQSTGAYYFRSVNHLIDTPSYFTS